MATLASVTKTASWGKASKRKGYENVIEYSVKITYTPFTSKFAGGIYNQSANYVMVMRLPASTEAEALDLIEELKKDKDFHENVNLYDFSISELLKGTTYECDAVTTDFSESENVTMLRFAFLGLDRGAALQNASARVIRRITKGMWKPVSNEGGE